MWAVVLAGLLLALRVFAENRDLVLQAMCADKCNKGGGGRECRERCYREPLAKAGFCGNSSDPFLNSCIDECRSDKDCFGLDKCCGHRCGRTCQPPHGLPYVTGLPKVPENVTLLQISDMRNVMVDWKHDGGCQYVIELREESGQWVYAHKAPRVVHPLRIPVRPGVEYSARVAAVSQYGSRGFSLPSNTIILHLEPKQPAAPTGLNFKGSSKNGSLSGLLSWQPGEPDQLISKYIIEWSQRFVLEDTPNRGTMEVHRKSVPHGKHCFRIKKLYPNSTYIFHVQAQLIDGAEKITSKPGTLTVDTATFSSISKRGIKQRSKHFRVYHKITKLEGGTHNVKISWSARERMKYAISWETDCDSKLMSVVTLGSHYVIPDLKANCTYQVFVREKSDCKKRRKTGKLTFKVP